MDMATSGEDPGSSSSSVSSSSSPQLLLSGGFHGSATATTVAAGSAGNDLATKLLEKPHLLTEIQRELLLRQVVIGGGSGGGIGGGQQHQAPLPLQQQQQQQQQSPQRPQQRPKPAPALPVHAFGTCRSNMPLAPRGGQVAVMRDYRFCIAMENSVAEDYVTEKVYAALDAGCLPVYYGAPNGLDFVPVPEAVIDYRALGGTPEALMAEIVRLNEDEGAYEAKMAWRKAGPAGWSPKFLALRERATEMSGQCAVCLKVAEALEKNREEEGSKKAAAGLPGASTSESLPTAATTNAAASTASTTIASSAATTAATTAASTTAAHHMAASRRLIAGVEQDQQQQHLPAAAESREISM